MKFQILPSLLMALSCQQVHAVPQDGDVNTYDGFVGNNLTISFFGADGNCVDGAGQPASSISLTTPSYNVDRVCFNLDQLFTQGNASGWKHEYNGVDIPPQFWGVNYTLENRQLYSSSRNYSGVWIQSTNITGIGSGLNSGRAVRVFEGRDCLTTGPYYSLSCQTPGQGQCFSTARTFRSFALDDAYPYIRANDGKCESFAPYSLNAATTISGKASLAATALVITAALWMSF